MISMKGRRIFSYKIFYSNQFDYCIIIRSISIQIHKKLMRNIHGVLNKVEGNGLRDTLAYSRYFPMYL